MVFEQKMPKLFRQAAILNEEEVITICKTVKDIEKKYGHPVDVEWVVEKNRKKWKVQKWNFAPRKHQLYPRGRADKKKNRIARRKFWAKIL